MPSAVGRICFPLRAAYPEETSFSIIPALVAGVPSPFFSVSSTNSLFPAVSIADNKVSSLYGLSGDVKCSMWYSDLRDSKAESETKIPAFIFIKSNLRLVVDLQQCVKAQQSHAYAQKVKLSNLQQMAKTVTYVQEHGYDIQDSLQTAFSEAQSHTADMRKALRSTEQKLKEVNEQIHYTGQYLANKSIYGEFLKSKNKKSF